MAHKQIADRREAFKKWPPELEWYFRRAVFRRWPDSKAIGVYARYNQANEKGFDSISVFLGSTLLHLDGSTAGRVEIGSSLDLGWTPDGVALPLLVPARVEGAEPFEKRIQLWSFPADDFRDLSLHRLDRYARFLIAYHRVTSVNSDANIIDHLIVQFLRWTHPRYYGGKWEWIAIKCLTTLGKWILILAAAMTIVALVLGSNPL